MDVVGNPNRRRGRRFEQPIHVHLAAAALQTILVVEAGEQVVQLVDHNDCLSRHCADRVGDRERRDPLAPIGHVILLVCLAAKLDGEAEVGAKRLGELGLTRSGRPVKEQVRAAARRPSEISCGCDNSGDKIAQVPQMPIARMDA